MYLLVSVHARRGEYDTYVCSMDGWAYVRKRAAVQVSQKVLYIG